MTIAFRTGNERDSACATCGAVDPEGAANTGCDRAPGHPFGHSAPVLQDGEEIGRVSWPAEEAPEGLTKSTVVCACGNRMWWVRTLRQMGSQTRGRANGGVDSTGDDIRPARPSRRQ